MSTENKKSINSQRRRKRQNRGGTHGPGAVVHRGEKARNFNGTIKKLIKYLGSYTPAIIVAFVLAAVSTAFNTIGPNVTGQVTTALFEGFSSKLKGR